MSKYPGFPKTPKLTTGENVKTGDRVRYRQAPGGILAASENWTHGKVIETDSNLTTHILQADNGYFYNLQSHIIEKL